MLSASRAAGLLLRHQLPASELAPAQDRVPPAWSAMGAAFLRRSLKRLQGPSPTCRTWRPKSWPRPRRRRRRRPQRPRRPSRRTSPHRRSSSSRPCPAAACTRKSTRARTRRAWRWASRASRWAHPGRCAAGVVLQRFPCAQCQEEAYLRCKALYNQRQTELVRRPAARRGTGACEPRLLPRRRALSTPTPSPHCSSSSTRCCCAVSSRAPHRVSLLPARLHALFRGRRM
jgi:hypothetical protein